MKYQKAQFEVAKVRLLLASKDAVLPSTTSPGELDLSYSGIINHGRRIDVIVCTLTSLVVGREAPGVCFALLGDDDAVVWSTCSVDGVLDVGQWCWLNQDLRSTSTLR